MAFVRDVRPSLVRPGGHGGVRARTCPYSPVRPRRRPGPGRPSSSLHSHKHRIPETSYTRNTCSRRPAPNPLHISWRRRWPPQSPPREVLLWKVNRNESRTLILHYLPSVCSFGMSSATSFKATISLETLQVPRPKTGFRNCSA